MMIGEPFTERNDPPPSDSQLTTMKDTIRLASPHVDMLASISIGHVAPPDVSAVMRNVADITVARRILEGGAEATKNVKLLKVGPLLTPTFSAYGSFFPPPSFPSEKTDRTLFFLADMGFSPHSSDHRNAEHFWRSDVPENAVGSGTAENRNDIFQFQPAEASISGARDLRCVISDKGQFLLDISLSLFSPPIREIIIFLILRCRSCQTRQFPEPNRCFWPALT